MDFFALVGGQQPAVYRMEIQQDLQQGLENSFQSCAAAFLSEELVAVPFERENFQPDETEILEIAPFDLPEHINQPIDNAVGWPTLPTDDDSISRVYCVFGHDPANERLIFQVIPRAQRLSCAGLTIILSGNTFNRLESPGLIIGSECHAVHQAGALRFRKLWWLKQFINIDSYYRAATDADVENFSSLNAVKIEDIGALKQRAGQWVRTRLAYILDSKILETFSPQQLSQKAHSFDVPLHTVNENGMEKLVIPQAPKQLRAVLKFLEEEYYEGPITGAAFEANSKRPLA